MEDVLSAHRLEKLILQSKHSRDDLSNRILNLSLINLIRIHRLGFIYLNKQRLHFAIRSARIKLLFCRRIEISNHIHTANRLIALIQRSKLQVN